MRLLKELDTLQIEVVLPGDQSYLAALQNFSPLIEQIKLHQKDGPKLMRIKKGVEEGKNKEFSILNEALWHGSRLCVPNITALKKRVVKWSTQLHTYYSPRRYEDVPWLEDPLLVEWDEKGHCKLRGSMSHLPKGGNWASKTWRTTTTFTYPGVEMGAPYHGSYCGNAENHQAIW